VKKKADKIKAFILKHLFPISVGLVVLLLSPFLYALITRLGLGSRFPVGSHFREMKPSLPSSALEIVAELPMPPGNVAVSSGGRIFFTFHPEYSPRDVKVAELKSKTSFKAYPNPEFQSKLFTCLSLRVDKQDRLWLLDFGNHGMRSRPTMYAFALRKRDKLVKEYVFPSSVAGFGSMLNDFQVDPSGNFIYIVDTGIVSTTPAIVVYSVRDDRSYRILSQHSSMYGFSSFLNVAGTWLNFGPMGLKINVDSIGLDKSGSKLYFGALTGDKMYSIPTSHLLHYARETNASFANSYLLDKNMPDHLSLVTTEKPATDGIALDDSGTIWMTAIEHSAIAVLIPVKMHDHSMPTFAAHPIFKLRKVVQDEKLLRWPDGLSFGPDGLYITNSVLHLKFSGQNWKKHAPFHILKLNV
jgi:sugar lactone lactonase YvrE